MIKLHNNNNFFCYYIKMLHNPTWVGEDGLRELDEPINNLIKGSKHGTHEFDEPIINLENPNEQLQ
jgi:hypothetical protein